MNPDLRHLGLQLIDRNAWTVAPAAFERHKTNDDSLYLDLTLCLEVGSRAFLALTTVTRTTDLEGAR